MWIFGTKGASGFSARSTAEEVTEGIDGAGLTAIVTGMNILYGSPSFLIINFLSCFFQVLLLELFSLFIGLFFHYLLRSLIPFHHRKGLVHMMTSS